MQHSHQGTRVDFFPRSWKLFVKLFNTGEHCLGKWFTILEDWQCWWISRRWAVSTGWHWAHLCLLSVDVISQVSNEGICTASLKPDRKINQDKLPLDSQHSEKCKLISSWVIGKQDGCSSLPLLLVMSINFQFTPQRPWVLKITHAGIWG